MILQNPNATQLTLLDIEITEKGAAFHLGNSKLSIVSDGAPVHSSTVHVTIPQMAQILQLGFMATEAMKAGVADTAPTSPIRQ